MPGRVWFLFRSSAGRNFSLTVCCAVRYIFEKSTHDDKGDDSSHAPSMDIEYNTYSTHNRRINGLTCSTFPRLVQSIHMHGALQSLNVGSRSFAIHRIYSQVYRDRCMPCERCCLFATEDARVQYQANHANAKTQKSGNTLKRKDRRYLDRWIVPSLLCVYLSDYSWNKISLCLRHC